MKYETARCKALGFATKEAERIGDLAATWTSGYELLERPPYN